MAFINETLDSCLQKTIQRMGDRHRIFYKDQSYSWQDIDAVADRLADQILQLNIPKGSHIGIWAGNSPAYISALFAIARLGCTAVLLNPAYKSFEMDRLIEYAELKGLFIDEKTVNQVHNVTPLKFVSYLDEDIMANCLKGDPLKASSRAKIEEVRKTLSPQDMAAMLFTSGTTAGPKGIELTHYQLLNVALRANEMMRWTDQDIVCLSLPLYHCFGMSTGVLAALFHGGKLCINDSFKSLAVMNCIEKFGCTVINGVPTMFLSVLNNPKRPDFDLSTLNSGIIAGSGVYEQDFLTISRQLDIPHLMQSYGQTEASPSITFSRYDDPVEKRATCVGVAIDDVEIRIWDENKNCALAPGEAGEIEIRGFNTMEGYYKKPEETAKTFREGGWMRTGDQGYLDAEGQLHVMGRIKEMIIRGGENICPGEIECILKRMDGIDQVKVFGVKEAVIQESIVACVQSAMAYSEDDIRRFVGKYLADYKIPKYVYFYEAFPLNSNGKIDGKAMKAEVEEKLGRV